MKKQTLKCYVNWFDLRLKGVISCIDTSEIDNFEVGTKVTMKEVTYPDQVPTGRVMKGIVDQVYKDLPGYRQSEGIVAVTWIHQPALNN